MCVCVCVCVFRTIYSGIRSVPFIRASVHVFGAVFLTFRFRSTNRIVSQPKV